MPELPEVETIARALRGGGRRVADGGAAPSLLGRRILAAQVLWDRTVAEPDALAFCARIKGQTIEAIGRRGKYLVLDLTDDTLLIHLRMTGDMIVEPSDSEGRKHDRLILSLDQDLRLVFHDPRKFGRVWLVPEPDRVLAKLGPEPLEAAFSAAGLAELLKDRRRQLKPLLLDQSVIAGIGNIYADEALHLARLHPLRRAHELSESEAHSLWRAIRQVLQEGIRRNGASIDWAYRGGEFQNQFQVYQRAGEHCFRCGSDVRRILVGQRSTHYCSVCQPDP